MRVMSPSPLVPGSPITTLVSAGASVVPASASEPPLEPPNELASLERLAPAPPPPGPPPAPLLPSLDPPAPILEPCEVDMSASIVSGPVDSETENSPNVHAHAKRAPRTEMDEDERNMNPPRTWQSSRGRDQFLLVRARGPMRCR